MKLESKELHTPPLDEVSKTFLEGLGSNFKEVDSKVVSCPDLTQSPWMAAAPGLCGSPAMGEIGGVPYLMPVALKEKIYDFKDLFKTCNIPEGFILGAGAGPYPFVGVNSELILNLFSGVEMRNKSKIVTVDIPTSKSLLSCLPPDETRCSMQCNFYSCQGLPGNVIYVKAKQRNGPMDFIGCLRKSLENRYQGKSVGFGGIFRLVKGSANVHVMPDFSKAPLLDKNAVNEWLHFYDMPAPMVFMSVAISKDPGLAIRLEHSHGHGVDYGGHYHNDVTPDEVEYEGYFNLAQTAYRIDKPDSTFQL